MLSAVDVFFGGKHPRCQTCGKGMTPLSKKSKKRTVVVYHHCGLGISYQLDWGTV